MAEEILRLRGVRKEYGAVQALRGVDLAMERGEVLALCGDNGAGKSTLIRLVSGAEMPTAGEIVLEGEPANFASPADALAKGVATIYQDLALAPRLQVYQNVFMGAELTRPCLLPFSVLTRDKKRRGRYWPAPVVAICERRRTSGASASGGISRLA